MTCVYDKIFFRWGVFFIDKIEQRNYKLLHLAPSSLRQSTFIAQELFIGSSSWARKRVKFAKIRTGNDRL
jgi:hypothetical protein